MNKQLIQNDLIELCLGDNYIVSGIYTNGKQMKRQSLSENHTEGKYLYLLKYIQKRRVLLNSLLIAASFLSIASCYASPEKVEEQVLAFINYEKSYYSKDVKTLSLMVDDKFVFTSTIDYLGSMSDSTTMNKKEMFELFKKQPDAYPAPSIDGEISVENNDTGYCVAAKNVNSSDDKTGIEEVVTRKVCFSSQGRVLTHLIQFVYKQ